MFRVAGIEVFLHWSWFVVAVIEIASQQNRYSSLAWNALEYLALFVIVLMHEFGHALACRQVGGKADRIMLWPLGGVAYVNPPLRPGATLWSIAAGPLVNVALLLPLGTLGGRYLLAEVFGPLQPQSDMATWLAAVLSIDIALLVFNILPIYPLDGGQILRSLLWYVLGRSRSFAVATGLGVLGAIALIGVALRWFRSPWLALIAGYMLLNSYSGLKSARAQIRSEKLPRRDGYLCPTCGIAPAAGTHWKCTRCGQTFDTFETGAVCPLCKSQFSTTMCMDCQQLHPLNDWVTSYSVSRVAADSESVTK